MVFESNSILNYTNLEELAGIEAGRTNANATLKTSFHKRKMKTRILSVSKCLLISGHMIVCFLCIILGSLPHKIKRVDATVVILALYTVYKIEKIETE